MTLADRDARRSWSQARRILCARLDARGDVMMTAPAMRAIKESLPGCKLTLLTSPDGAEVEPLIAEIDRCIVYESPWMKSTPPRETSQPDLAMIEDLRAGGFDGAIIFTVYSQNPLPAAFLCHLAGIPLRLAHCHENPYQLLTDWVPDPEPTRVVRHEVQRQLDLVETAGFRTADNRIVLRVPHAAGEEARAILGGLALDPGRPWVVMHPGASAPSRRYPPEGFARAAGELAAGHGWQVLFTGSTGEVALVEGIRAQINAPSQSLAGKLTFPQFAALIQEAPLLIANNTSAVHLAAGLGTPVVDLYALTNPQHTPWRVPSRVLSHDVPCRNCYKSVCPEGHHNCLRLVSPASVVDAALALYAETHAIPSDLRP